MAHRWGMTELVEGQSYIMFLSWGKALRKPPLSYPTAWTNDDIWFIDMVPYVDIV